jgi:hypothetical protein
VAVMAARSIASRSAATASIPGRNPDPRDGDWDLGMMHDNVNAEKSLYGTLDSLLRYACLFLKKAR